MKPQLFTNIPGEQFWREIAPSMHGLNSHPYSLLNSDSHENGNQGHQGYQGHQGNHG